jgi:hypothetical protein
MDGRSRGRELARLGLLVTTLALLLAPGVAVAKRLPLVAARFEGLPGPVPVGTPVSLVLRLVTTVAAHDVIAEILAPDGVQIAGSAQWSGSLPPDGVVDVPVSVRVPGAGEYTLGARVTSRTPAGSQVSGASLTIVAAGGIAEMSGHDPFVTKAARASGAAELAALGLVAPAGGPVRDPGSDRYAVTGTVSGTVRWLDPEGHAHPVRGARVQVFDGGAGGPLLADANTDVAGAYGAAVTAGSNTVSVRVYTEDFLGGMVATIFPPGQPALRHTLTVGPVPLSGNPVVDLTTPQPARGTPGLPDQSPGTVSARAFAVYDAMVTYWVQASGLLGRNMPPARTVFPEPTSGGLCNTSCFSPGAQEIHILRDDAFDWDVLGHEFFHFTTDVFSRGGRSIDDNPGGPHSGGSAIGQAGRSRDAGMRLAWSEGLATFMALALQRAPLPSVVPFPASLVNLGNASYEDTEDVNLFVPAESPLPSDGFGSENSVLALFWDLFDASPDIEGSVADTFAGTGPQVIWNAITAILPCDPCNRIDRFWSAITVALGPLNPVTLDVSRLFVLEEMAPRTVAPADGASVASGAPPTFQWLANGDPSPTHQNDTFFLVFSRDDFGSHVFVLSPPPGATSYQPAAAEWMALQQGGAPGAAYRWFVAGLSSGAGPGNPPVPEGIPWFSDVRAFTIGPVGGAQPPARRRSPG